METLDPSVAQEITQAAAMPLETRLAPMWSPERNEATSRGTRAPRRGMRFPPWVNSISGRTVC
jgi:hypothetical protein